MKSWWIRLVVLVLALLALLALVCSRYRGGTARFTMIEDQYIVAFKAGAAPGPAGDPFVQLRTLVQQLRAACGNDVQATMYYPLTLFGVAVKTSKSTVPCVSGHPSVAFVEQDRWLYGADVQSNPTWGLDRIDEDSYPLDHAFQYSATAGAGVKIWVLDTGVKEDPDLEERVTCAQNFVPDSTGTAVSTDCDDANGHGTGVAGIAAGTTYGVAKKAEVMNVRVLDADNKGQNSWILGGVEWVAANATGTMNVVNMSLETVEQDGTTQALDTAIKSGIAKGIPFVVAAGNDASDACNFSPGHVTEAIVVGATKKSNDQDWVWPSSNEGACVDLFAPGVLITSYWGMNIPASKDGTSCAAPHVAGAVAVYLGDHPTATMVELEAELVGNATYGTVQGLSASSPNKILRLK